MAGRSTRYLELADELATRWSSLPPGSLVDSEHQLAAQFDVGRLTAREAVRELERRLIVRRVMGRGTYTAHRVDYRVALGDVPSFRRVLADAGHEPGVRPISMGRRGRGASRRFEIERVLTIDGLVASFGRDRFDGDIGDQIAEIADDERSIVEMLTVLGCTPRRAGVRIAMEAPEPEVAVALGFSAAVPPVWRLDSTTRDGDGGPIVHRSTSWMRADMFEVTVHLGDDATPV